MYLIIGLGNPGDQFKGTRHNLGFEALDYLAAQHDGVWQDKTKLRGSLAKIKVGEASVLLLKPATFYNETGHSARAAQDFYKIDNSATLTIHDELALPFGMIRSRLNGSDAGNNGVKNLNAHLGDNYARIRVGISSEQKININDTDFVLTKFSHQEQSNLKEIYKKIALRIESFIKGDFSPTSHKL